MNLKCVVVNDVGVVVNSRATIKWIVVNDRVFDRYSRVVNKVMGRVVSES